MPSKKENLGIMKMQLNNGGTLMGPVIKQGRVYKFKYASIRDSGLEDPIYKLVREVGILNDSAVTKWEWVDSII